jgi:hypothetical protein
MTHNLHVLIQWIRIVALVTATCTTAVPVIYSTFPWRTRRLGKLFMAQAVSFAAAMDLTAVFSYWHPKNILLVFWIDAVVLTLVSVSTASLAGIMISARFFPKKDRQTK